MNKILIIDDDRELCALIKRSVQAENIEADFCNTGKEGLQKLREQEYQLVVLDVMMPGMDGFETLEEIRKENSLPILMFTSKNDSISKVRGLRAGADDYLTKPFDMDELIARIASLIRRYTRFNQQAGAIQKLNFDGLQIDLENRSVTTSNGTFELPPKEFDLLLYCSKHQGKILTKQQIYEEVWGEEYFYDMDSYMRIVNNLIQNVIAHSHADKIKIALSKKENNMELLLADNGVGIEKDDLKHIFERLYKCDKGRSEKGSGLGLSIVHQLVEKMGGSITVESFPGEGTEFMLLFPLEI